MEPGSILARTLLAVRGSFRILPCTLVVTLSCIVAVPSFARTVQEKKQAAALQFQVAERLRQSLSAKAESRRTEDDYQRVLDAYRRVYHGAPTYSKADAAVLAVADLLEEQGRILSDPKSLKDAIGQLEFLRREYPGSKYRAHALYTIAQIYRDDLDDSVQARAVFEDFLKHYPGSDMAASAKDEIDDIDAKSKKSQAEQAEKDKSSKTGSKAKSAANEKSASPAPPSPGADSKATAQAAAPVSEHHHPPLLTGVRHWSTPDYTRVAIDLEEEVQYEAGRIDHPDRIFFDLHGAKVPATLDGRAFTVDDGFLHKIRVAQFKPNLARVVLDVDDVAEYSAFLLPNPYRLIIDIHGRKTASRHPVAPAAKNPQSAAEAKRPTSTPPTEVQATHSESERVAQTPEKQGQTEGQERSTPDRTTSKPAEVARAETPKKLDDSDSDDNDLEEGTRDTSKPTTSPTYQSVAPKDSRDSNSKDSTRSDSPRSKESKDKAHSRQASASETAHAASPTADGERSLIRALGLKIGKIVIDAGHGGHDTGTIGPNGLMEKDLVLDVALKLGKLLEDRLGAQVVYTRDDDTFIPLESRTAIANKEQADLFISVHANSSPDPGARGIETYYLNFTSSADALEVAARENAVSEKSIHELQDLVKKIALKEKIDESREFALDVQKSLYNGLVIKSPGLQNRGVKKAPFVVLIGANMPSILAEISFVSNPTDERKLKTGEYRERVAESLYHGVSKYISGLSGVRVASRSETDEERSTRSDRSAANTQHSAAVHSGNAQ